MQARLAAEESRAECQTLRTANTALVSQVRELSSPLFHSLPPSLSLFLSLSPIFLFSLSHGLVSSQSQHTTQLNGERRRYLQLEQVISDLRAHDAHLRYQREQDASRLRRQLGELQRDAAASAQGAAEGVAAFRAAADAAAADLGLESEGKVAGADEKTEEDD